ncbi:helix-turn-helix domain-containing protein [Kitasatospora cineracea]|uniref:helix-turn-helix domain-containing protein n=1 Tax=Kitasatospora cineracea TaxID=88074 RepID=UPI0037997D02
MDRDWGRLSRRIAAEREALALPQQPFADQLGVSRSAVQKLESGHAYRKITPLHRSVERIFDWEEGSVEAILVGGEPTVRDVVSSPIEAGVDALLDDLTARVREALLGGTVADATAIDMGPEDDGEVVIIWKRGEKRDLTPEQQRDLRRRWGKLQHAARDILADDGEQEDQ